MGGVSTLSDGTAVINYYGSLTLQEPNPEQRHRMQPTTLGTAVTALDEYEIDGAIRATGLWTRAMIDALPRRHHRDWAIAEASGRWSPDLQPRRREFVPGDVCGVRAAACQGSLVSAERVQRDVHGPASDQTNRRAERELVLGAWLYEAVPFFLPVTSAITIAGSYPPDDTLLDELRLPYPRLGVYFGADLTIPARLRGHDGQLAEVARAADALDRSGPLTVRADEFPPFAVCSSQLELMRGHELCLSGLVFHADAEGRLADVVSWLTVAPDAAEQPRRITPGLLSRSTLRPVALNLAAAAAWGDWQPPGEIDLPDDPDSRMFRRELRRSAFRRREPTGAAIGVRVIDARRRERRTSRHAPGTHASPVTHHRRGHWRRQRVGPRDAWHYERRHVPPVIVNPGHESGIVTVYRLPDPPE